MVGGGVHREPRTADEREEFGSGKPPAAGPKNLAGRLVERVRRQKGTFLEQPLVQEGEKMKHYSVSGA